MSGLLFANVAATAAICLILLLRRIFRNRLFARFFVLLWLLVIFRLLLPFEFSSGISFYSPVQPPENVFSESTGETFFSPGIIYPEILPEGNSESPEKDSAKISSGEFLLCIWLSGAVFTGGFFVLKHRFSVKRILADCVPFENVSTEFSGGKTRFFKSKALCSPLSFGILRPTVVIPESTGEKQLPFVLLHEQIHLKNRDPALKALALCALSLNWFNPAVWVMVKFFDRDLELSCDERVLKTLGNEKALAYANTILDFAERESLSLSFFSASSLCERVTSIMKNKNKKSCVLAATAIFSAVVLLMTACGTVPAPEERKPISAGKLSAENSEAEEIDSALQEMVESELEKGSGNYIDIVSGEIVGQIPGLAEELMGYYGDVPPNNYVTESYTLPDVEKIEKISVSGFSFAEGASVNILLIESNEAKVSITYGDALRKNGICVFEENGEISVSVGTPCENLEEAFDLRIFGNFEYTEFDIDPSFPISSYVALPEKESINSHEPGYQEIYLAVDDFELQIVSPVGDGWIASKFGSYKGHTGIDIGSKTGTGTEILAAADGTVVKVKRDNTGYGYHVIINHGNGIQTCYAHLGDILVELGQEVKAGDVIASMGSTGNSTGIHLHFEIRINGEYVDPEKYISLSRDEKSRTFSSNSKRSYILRTSSRSRRLILSSIVSFAVWLKCTRTI